MVLGATVKLGYKLTEVGVIPEDWEVRSIGQMFQLFNGCAFKPEDWKQSGIPIIRIQNLNDPFASFNFSQAPVSEKNRVEAGDLLFAWSGTVGTSFGARLWAGPSGVLNQHIFKVLVDEQQITLPFSLLVFARVEEDIAKQAHGFKASFVHVKKSDLVKLNLPVPPIPEQRAIAAALSDVDALLAGLDRFIVKKRDLKQAAMQQLLTGNVRLPGFADTWATTFLGELAEIVSGGTPATSEPTYWNGDIKWCTPTDITASPGKYLLDTARSISTLGLRSSGARLLPAGALLLCSRATIGELKIAAYEVCTNQGFKSLVCRPHVNNEFLYYKLLTMKAQMVERAFGSTFLEISTANVAALGIAVPSLQEQSAIAEVLSGMDEELAALEARRAKIGTLKQAMMQELLTGRIRLI